MDKKKRPPLNLAKLNEILFAEDLAYIFNITAKQAGQNLASGAYFARLRIGKELVQVKQMMLVK